MIKITVNEDTIKKCRLDGGFAEGFINPIYEVLKVVDHALFVGLLTIRFKGIYYKQPPNVRVWLRDFYRGSPVTTLTFELTKPIIRVQAVHLEREYSKMVLSEAGRIAHMVTKIPYKPSRTYRIDCHTFNEYNLILGD